VFLISPEAVKYDAVNCLNQEVLSLRTAIVLFFMYHKIHIYQYLTPFMVHVSEEWNIKYSLISLGYLQLRTRPCPTHNASAHCFQIV